MVCIIAEIGINFNNDLNVARNMIRDAAIAGANIAKFQLYSPSKLFGPGGEDDNPIIYEGVKGTELKKEDVVKLMKWCNDEGIEFGASVFDYERFSWLEELNIRRYKIASRTSKLTRDLAEAIAKTGKPCWMSLGFNSQPLDAKYTNVQYLHCVSSYPAEYSEINFPTTFKGTIYSGVSDHSPGIESCLVALSRGAVIVEKHITYNKAGTVNANYDHTCSITFDELAELVKYAKLIEKITKYC